MECTYGEVPGLIAGCKEHTERRVICEKGRGKANVNCEPLRSAELTCISEKLCPDRMLRFSACLEKAGPNFREQCMREMDSLQHCVSESMEVVQARRALRTGEK